MKKFGKIIIVIILIGVLILLTGCNKNEEDELKEKAISELAYVNTEIIGLLNNLNNISFENYTIKSEKAQLDEESSQSESGQQGSSSEESSSGSGEKSGGSGGESGGSGGGQSGEQNNKEINTIEMVTDSILTKDRNQIDWEPIKSEIELLNESWSVILLDLYRLNITNENLLDFSGKINSCIVAIKNEDKQQSLNTLADLYSSIPVFLQQINADKNLQNIRQTQSYVINSYVLAEDMGNTQINTNITNALEKYGEVMSNIDYSKDKTYKINKVYVLLNELATSLDEKDSDVFYVKYKNFMEGINSIE